MNIAEPQDGHVHVIVKDVPVEVWDAFLEKSKREMPESGDTAGHAVLGEVMYRALENQAVMNMWITDLPREIYEGFAGLLSVLKISDKPLTPEEFFILQFKAGAKDYKTLSQLYGRFLSSIAPDGCVEWGIKNVKREAYEEIKRVLALKGVTPEQFLEMLADTAAQKKFSIQETGKDGNVSTGQTGQGATQANGNKTGVGRIAARKESLARGRIGGDVVGSRPAGHDKEGESSRPTVEILA